MHTAAVFRHDMTSAMCMASVLDVISTQSRGAIKLNLNIDMKALSSCFCGTITKQVLMANTTN